MREGNPGRGEDLGGAYLRSSMPTVAFGVPDQRMRPEVVGGTYDDQVLNGVDLDMRRQGSGMGDARGDKNEWQVHDRRYLARPRWSSFALQNPDGNSLAPTRELEIPTSKLSLTLLPDSVGLSRAKPQEKEGSQV